MENAIKHNAISQIIISRNAIKDISIWFGNKLSINFTVPTPEKVIISKVRASEFKTWLLGRNKYIFY